ncbi:Yip1 family protein [Bacillus spongiae]|uniref:Yip1 family protein n=1 Tax=Bacillus spongiae TaxID=2683610 RepID=A0ABU8HF98_9BACI
MVNTTEDNVTQQLNPWLSIWTRPRDTMKQVYKNGGKHIFLLFFLGVLVMTLDNATGSYEVQEGWASLLLLNSLMYFIITLLLYYFVSPPLIAWIGRSLGGDGTTERVRYALAYSFIPYVYTLVIVWIPLLALFGFENFTTNTSTIESNIILALISWPLGLIDLIIGIWGFFITLKCIGEAHEFSAWKAFLTVLIPMIFLLIIIFVIGLVLAF